mmetsp:Transcript_18978/g.39728  ORF Transcript_18978/g.39728 Transcript_18978/m.39728 type:complete len:244 (-) Transcript_18978:210-941(-)
MKAVVARLGAFGSFFFFLVFAFPFPFVSLSSKPADGVYFFISRSYRSFSFPTFNSRPARSSLPNALYSAPISFAKSPNFNSGFSFLNRSRFSLLKIIKAVCARLGLLGSFFGFLLIGAGVTGSATGFFLRFFFFGKSSSSSSSSSSLPCCCCCCSCPDSHQTSSSLMRNDNSFSSRSETARSQSLSRYAVVVRSASISASATTASISASIPASPELFLRRPVRKRSRYILPAYSCRAPKCGNR